MKIIDIVDDRGFRTIIPETKILKITTGTHNNGVEAYLFYDGDTANDYKFETIFRCDSGSKEHCICEANCFLDTLLSFLADDDVAYIKLQDCHIESTTKQKCKYYFMKRVVENKLKEI